MISFRKLITSNRLFSWNAVYSIPILTSVVLLVHGLYLGLTDDEAYYWVLAQRPALGYAYHPPAVAWVIALAQAILSPFFGAHSVWVVRLPSALGAGGILYLALNWVRRAGGASDRLPVAGVLLLSFAGFFGLAWMMVPDIPLFLAWTLAFSVTWNLCFEKECAKREYFWLGFAVMFLILSKYSGVLAALSAAGCLLIWAPRARFWRGAGAIAAGAFAALLPIVIWNATHEWTSILYQISERHQGGNLSLVRYARFWAIEALVAGPCLLIYGARVFRRAFRSSSGTETPARELETRVGRFALLWAGPGALVFLLQPLWADFKPHWAFVVWWPIFLILAWAVGRGRDLKWARIQMLYGLPLVAFILLSCHLPMGGLLMKDPRLDVTNDLYGWSELREFIGTKLPDEQKLPIIGSRYQTAAQAAFAIGQGGKASLLPLDLKAKDEWPDLGISLGVGPEWPRLTSPVLFVSDNRYDSGPAFPGAQCRKLARLEKKRWIYLAKWIDVWRCEPGV